MAAPAPRPVLSIVVPTLNAAGTLGPVLDAVCDLPVAGGRVELVVSDGGSTDGTRALAERHGARVIAAPRGRGPQLAAGAAMAAGPWLLFLHADSVPGPGWREAIEEFAATPENRQRAGYFRLALDDRGAPARRIERLANWRARRLGLPYGDQGLLIHRSLYQEVGGYRPLPLMEDVDLVRRLGRKRLHALSATARTSAARYRRGGWWLRPLRNLSTLALYYAGVPPRVLARLYR
jgi:rSAM/selenodomain-associated transferase 2